MDVTNLCLLTLIICGCTYAQLEAEGEFPSPTAVSLYRPVFATSTCGDNGVETYCQYTTDANASLAPNCIATTCNSTCRFSSSSPSSTDLTSVGTHGGGVTSSSEIGPGETTVLDFIDSFISIQSSSAPQMSTNGFTFAAWIRQDTGNNGALISKASSDGLNRTYAITVTETSLVFDYFPSNAESGYSSLTFANLDLSSSYWHHITVTIYDNDCALYINGTIKQAAGLVASIQESTNTIYLGQISPNLNFYNGLMQNVYSFSQALTAREVEELFSNEFAYNNLQSECRCPPSHPLINSDSFGLCIQHTGVETDRGSVARLNSLSHAVGYVNDNNFITTWISGIETQQSNVTMTLTSGSNSAYEVLFVFIRYSSPAPKAAVLEKSIDGGTTYVPLQYFADDCNSYFGLENDAILTSNDDVNCVTQYSSQTPTSGVTARVRFVDGSRDTLDSSNVELQNFILSDHIRLRMIDYFTENTTSQHRYYGILDITVAARCACNGHAPRCSTDIRAICDCVHNTQGDRCDECLPLYNNKPWRIGTSNLAYPCKICNCNNHGTSCYYNASIDPFPDDHDLGGGGVCNGCQDNTAGDKCETCALGYYRMPGVNLSDSEPCTGCNCNVAGSIGEDCVKHEGIPGKVAGQCDCKTNVEGLTCNECKEGYFNLSSSNSNGCEPCSCNTDGTVGGVDTCNAITGRCVCKLNVEGLKCDQCINGTQGLSASNPDGCSSCNCNLTGSVSNLCDPNTGDCTCKPGVGGSLCDQCLDSYYGYSESGCQQCQCSSIGSTSLACDVNNGNCICNAGYMGQNCDVCQDGYFSSSQLCLPCQCNSNGTLDGQVNNCDSDTGQCSCKDNIMGRDCDTCVSNYTSLSETGCSECDCVLVNTDTSGVLCDPVTAQCACLSSAYGIKCDQCQDGFYSDEEEKCLGCNCDEDGSVSINCAPLTGQCFCINENITGQSCNQCEVGHYDFPNCNPCQCDVAGSINSVCSSDNGECLCKEFVMGMNCDTCLQGYETLEASNPFGCSADPEEQNPPSALEVLSRSIVITWSPPEKPNGVIALYEIVRNGTLLDSIPGSVLSYNDTGLTPNTVYVYQIEAENIAGSTLSEGVSIQTLEGAPEQVNRPTLTVINSTSVRANWGPPNITNGVITRYNLILVAVDNVYLELSLVTFSNLAFTHVVTDLSPFTVNTFVLEACTSQDCGPSEEVTAMTAESRPQSQDPPTLIAIGSTTINVSWVEPSQPNGIIIKYEIYQRNSPFTDSGFSIGNVSSDDRSFTVTGLQPFTEYEFSVASFTIVGGTQSEWTRENTIEAAPENLPDPIVSPVSSSEILVEWTEPDDPNGVILSYRVFIQYSNSSQVNIATSSLPGNFTVSGLMPFTNYGFYIIACNSVECTNSTTVYNTTLESAPTGLQTAELITSNITTLSFRWNPPTMPNGIITDYSITRMQPSLQSSPAKRSIGTSFYGADFASYPPSSELEGFSITVTLMFKTLRSDGVLIYSMNSLRTDMLAIELRNGIPWFVYDAGSGPAAITVNDTDTKYNDGKWHELIASHSGKNGSLMIDQVSRGTGVSIGSAEYIGEPNVLYIGGLENDAPLTTINGNANANATLNGFNFAGCLHGVKFKDHYLNFSTLLNPNPGVDSSSNGCPMEQEYGISFLGGGYLSMPYSAPGINSFSISLWFRTTEPSSLLLFAYGDDSYIAAMLTDNHIVFEFSGTNSNRVSLSSSQRNLCDGEWYKLDIVKETDGLVITVANQSISTPIGNVDINTTSNLYIGGVLVSSVAWNKYYDLFLSYPNSFSGCMRNFEKNGERIDLHKDFGDELKHVRFDGCDISSSIHADQVCTQQKNVVELGLETMYTDSNLIPFTEYLYQVTAQNSVDKAFSQWSLGMTTEDRPEMLGVVGVTGSFSTSLTVNWSPPESANGIVTRYEITSTPINTIGLDAPLGSVNTSIFTLESPIQELTTQLTGLLPATNYSIVLAAFTGAGVGTGPPVFVLTVEEIPVGVQTPIVTSKGSTEIELQWGPPTQPNGIIVHYRIYIANIAITTTEMSATISSLEPFTLYEYILEACTSIGCANGSAATVFTSESAPVGQQPPSLLSLSSSSIQASWTPPNEPNGVILYYELYRRDEQLNEELVANTTQLSASVSGLSPSTLYYFRVIVYNSIGSVSSNSSSITTPEDTPEQILPPNVTVIDSMRLLLEWQEPLQPNGIITNYTLFRNGASIFTGETNLSHIDTGLTPFTSYQYFILVCTSKGCGASSPSIGQTAEAVPESIQQPDIISVTSSTVLIRINSADKPNGIVQYILRMTGEFLDGYDMDNLRLVLQESRIVFNSSVTGMVTVEQLLPFQTYSMTIEVQNGAGSAFGDPITFTTLSAVPEQISAPEVSLLSSTVLNIAWDPPLYPNGDIVLYTVSVHTTVSDVIELQTHTFNANTTKAIIYDLRPFSMYSVSVTATNEVGNVTSEETTIVTGEIAPSNFDQPTVVSTTSYSIAITWDPPASPNGVILNYTVTILQDDLDFQVDSTPLAPNTRQYNITELAPFTDYNISVEVCNSAGCEIGPSINSKTDEAAPELITSPSLSTTPVSVIIYWEEPQEPNGIITYYTIYRSLIDGEFSIIQTIPVMNEDEQLEYIDTNVEPFTTYQYYIEAGNSAGSGQSNSSNILTEESAPENVPEPVLEPLSSLSVLITILPPQKPNGIITKYTIGRYLTEPLDISYFDVQVSNISNQNISYIDTTNLDPYTIYNYFVIAFTVAGNATGNSSTVQTLEAPPTDLSPPSIALTTDTSILIGWSPPLEENGIITSYEIVRGDFGYYGSAILVEDFNRCCQNLLDRNESSGYMYEDICTVVAETAGDTTSYINNELDPFVHYRYCIAAYNSAGGVASISSVSLQTSAALQPIAGPDAIAEPLNSTAINVSWSIPDVTVLLGPLNGFTLYSKESDESGLGDVLYSGFENTYLATGLMPSTEYTFVVEVDNSRGSTVGTPVNAETFDGIPLGVKDPVVIATSATTLKVSWVEPTMPNGEIIEYSIFLNGEIYHNQSTPGSITVTNLKPFTAYVVRLEACTILGCTKSGLSSNTTFEAAPEGFASPTVDVLSPYSVLISWTEPTQHNGIITQYNVYVRECSDGVCYEGNNVFTGLTFNYTLEDLDPATMYGFEVIVINGGGNTSSGITTETTHEAPPTLLLPPDVTTLSAYSILIEWEEPDEPNGVISGYMLFRNGELINGILNSLSYTDTLLMPFTKYNYIIQACTNGGCTNSTETANTTLEAQPSGFDDPIFTNIQSDSVIITWSEPSSPNGVIISYSVYFNNDTTIFTGLTNTTAVTGLSPYTNYSFYIQVCNNADCLESNIVAVVTLEAPPLGLSPPTVRDLSSTSVEVSWQAPSQPRGIITSYILRRDNGVIFNGTAFVHDDESLLPNTQYSYTVEAVNGAGSVISAPIVIHTQADIPSGVQPPTVTVLSSTAIFVAWAEPENSNGEISSYKLFVNDDELFSGLQLNYTVAGLTPFTNYSLYIQVCNQIGCASSKSVTSITDEDIPAGLSAPSLVPVSATSVSVSWSEPSSPNGMITAYRVVRRETNNPLLVLIQFVGSGDVTSFVNQDLSPYTSYEYQVLAFNSKGSTESAWVEVRTLEAPPTGLDPPTFPEVQSTYIVVSWEEPANPNGVLKQYEVLYRPLLGELLSYQITPTNVTAVNVTGLVPYTFYEFRIVVTNGAGQYESDFGDVQTLEDAPVGVGTLILVTRTSESLTLTWDEPSIPNGIISEYVLYLDGSEEYRDSLKTATIDRLDPFTGYSLLLEACTSVACTQGVIQGFTTEESAPIGQPHPVVTLIDAKSVMVSWEFPAQPNGIITSFEVFRLEVPEPLVENSTDGSILVYSTDIVSNRIFNDTSLVPDTGYQYAIRGNNSVGSSLSAFTYIQTPQAPPELVQIPILEVLGARNIKITWDPPGQTNGEITEYTIYRIDEDISVYTGLNREFTDSGLDPYNLYTYIIEACTIAGCTNSTTANDTTEQDIPESVEPPTVTALSSTSLSVSWMPPLTPNGEIVMYIVHVVEPVSINITTEADMLTTIVSTLLPFTTYSVRIEACTIVGCVSSDTSTNTTLESVPMLQDSPTVLPLGPTSVDVYWNKPAVPNGVIINYILRRNDSIVYEGLMMSFIDENLLANQYYVYDIQSFTGVGGGDRSPYSIVRTDSDTPTGINPPTLLSLDSTSILATWSAPNVTNGDIQKYILYVNESAVYEGPQLGHLLTELEIFTTYSFRVEACTSTCGSSLHSFGMTLEDLPEGQSPPILSLSTNETVLITWSTPSQPNGIILMYSIERTQVVEGEYSSAVVIAELPNTVEQLIDSDDSLLPATTYGYRITSTNSIGSVTSSFADITLPDGIPQNLSAPVLVTVTSTSLTVRIDPPQVSNGVLTKYTLFGDNLFPIVQSPLSQTEPVLFTHSEIEPFTSYRVYAEICTVGGCALGPSSTFVTNEDIPEGLLAPFVTTETPRRIRIEWTPPSSPNGIITGYQLFFKLPCPQPLTATTTQCTETRYSLLVNTSDTTFSFDSTTTLLDPYPYTSYQFLLQAENSAGAVNSSETDIVTTDESIPEQVNPLLFTLYPNNQSIALNWGSTFIINGQLKSYTVIRDGVFLLIGPQTYAVFPNQPLNTVLQFSVRVSNTNFQFTTPSIPLQLNVGQVTATTAITASPSNNATEAPSDTQFYEDAAFIVGMVVLAVIICFVLMIILLCLIRPNRNQSSDKYDTLKSEKGTPIREDGTVGSGWTHERVTPVPSYNDALQNYPMLDRRTGTSYSPSKAETMGHDTSYSPQSKAELTAMFFQEETPLVDTHISRLSVHEDIPMKEFTPGSKKKEYSLERVDEVSNEGSYDPVDENVVTLRKNLPITHSQESMLDTKI